MNSLLLTAAFLILPLADITRESVDAVEINAHYDEHGRLVFTQAIFKLWNEHRHDVSAWRLIGDGSGDKSKILPQRDHKRGGYVLLWHDGSVLREVRTNSVDFSWTQHDPELIDREYLPKEMRRELRKPH